MALFTESSVRACIRVKDGRRVFYLGPGDRLTPSAREWLRQERIDIVQGEQPKPKTYETLFGGTLTEKPEHMTHLYGNVLVPKAHPHIFFRGKLDSLGAQIVLTQSILAETAGGHPQLLKLISMNYIAIERNCSLEKLTAFKREILPFRDRMREALGKYFPNASEERKEHFLLALLSLMQGLYSMTNLTEKQLKAMKRADSDYVQPDFEKNFCQALFSLSAELI